MVFSFSEMGSFSVLSPGSPISFRLLFDMARDEPAEWKNAGRGASMS
jgi:hypothetical protein